MNLRVAVTARSSRHAQKSHSNNAPVTAAQRFARTFSGERASEVFHCIVTASPA
jgi:hypothetical protein